MIFEKMNMLSLHLALLSALLFTGQTRAQDLVLDGKWRIDVPSFRNDRLDLFLNYAVSDYIPYENIGWSLYSGRQCGNGAEEITINDYLVVSKIINDDSIPQGNGSSTRNVTLAFSLDPDTIRDSPILQNDGFSTATVSFCVHMSAYTADIINPGKVEIMFRETFLTLVVKLEGTFEVADTVLVPLNRGDEVSNQTYYLIGYLVSDCIAQLYCATSLFLVSSLILFIYSAIAQTMKTSIQTPCIKAENFECV
jgi:hypothetical protein